MGGRNIYSFFLNYLQWICNTSIEKLFQSFQIILKVNIQVGINWFLILSSFPTCFLPNEPGLLVLTLRKIYFNKYNFPAPEWRQAGTKALQETQNSGTPVSLLLTFNVTQSRGHHTQAKLRGWSRHLCSNYIAYVWWDKNSWQNLHLNKSGRW